MKETFFLFVLTLVLFLSAAALSYFLTWVLARVAVRYDLLDYPSLRKNHGKPIPFLGGAAVFLSFWLVVLGGILAAHGFNMVFPVPKILGIFLGGLVVFLTGLLDDKFRWSAWQKLAGQAAAALILMNGGLTINLVSGLGALGYVITFFWIVLIINAFNFIDSLDGHCAGIALISTLVFFWITQIINQPLVGLFLIAFAGALTGFLPHNFKPAKIFLGDNGSLFIGYVMAAVTLLCRYQTPGTPYAAVFIPVLVFGVPIYDTLSVISVRLARGICPWEGDRNHFAHRLVKIGMGERVAVIFSYFVAVTVGLVAIVITQVSFFGSVLVGLIFLSILGVIGFLEFYVTRRFHP